MNPPSRLTFVVIPLIGGAALERCIAALRGTPAPIMVVGRLGAGLEQSLRSRGLTTIESDAPVPRRRAIGAAAADTEWISFCEDSCVIGPTWYPSFETLLPLRESDAWSGPIEIDADLPPRCAALAALEYGEFGAGRWTRLATAPGSAWRPVRRLAGLNLLYRAAALPTPAPPEGLIETEVNERASAQGRPLAMHPGLAVTYSGADLSGASLASRHAHGRIYGGGLRARLPALSRALAVVKCAALPLVLTARGFAGLPSKHRGNIVTLAWLAGFAIAWSVGEATGLLLGRGTSIEAWR
ncbi:MAG: hypothetical protein ABI460_01055 [Caldimonas sp.]